MRTILAGAFLLAISIPAQTIHSFAPPPVTRPKILGIAYVQFEHSDMQKTRDFYSKLLGMPYACIWYGDRYRVSDRQSIIMAGRDPQQQSSDSFEQEIVFRTSDAEAMRRYLTAHGYKPSGGTGFVEVDGPEHLKIGFANDSRPIKLFNNANGDPVSTRIIHVGFVVHDRAAADKFFRDLLGFKLYWTGGPSWDGTSEHSNYASMQVPDGHEWVEYMLNRPANLTAKQNGGPNHVALGVADIQKAREQLIKNGWTGDAQPRLGQDGKWQLNLFDPDGTRIELMEFTPAREPCCTPYQQQHPSPGDR